MNKLMCFIDTIKKYTTISEIIVEEESKKIVSKDNEKWVTVVKEDGTYGTQLVEQDYTSKRKSFDKDRFEFI